MENSFQLDYPSIDSPLGGTFQPEEFSIPSSPPPTHPSGYTPGIQQGEFAPPFPHLDGSSAFGSGSNSYAGAGFGDARGFSSPEIGTSGGSSDEASPSHVYANSFDDVVDMDLGFDLPSPYRASSRLHDASLFRGVGSSAPAASSALANYRNVDAVSPQLYGLIGYTPFAGSGYYGAEEDDFHLLASLPPQVGCESQGVDPNPWNGRGLQAEGNGLGSPFEGPTTSAMAIGASHPSDFAGERPWMRNMYRSASSGSENSVGSCGSSLFGSDAWSGGYLEGFGIDPTQVNPHSGPVTPERHDCSSLDSPYDSHEWAPRSNSIDSLVDGIQSNMGLDQDLEVGEEGESTVRARERTRDGLAAIDFMAAGGSYRPVGAHPGSFNSSSGFGLGLDLSPDQNTVGRSYGQFKATGNISLRVPTERSSPRSSPMLSKGKSTKGKKREIGMAAGPTRGRVPQTREQLGLGEEDELQAVASGELFDPLLNPDSNAVQHCTTTKRGRPKRIFLCKGEGCNKTFRRGEHLKRHEKCVHGTEKPFGCPWGPCDKDFNRHDNLNQHLQVHIDHEIGGEILKEISVGPRGVVRDIEKRRIDPALLPGMGLKYVEVGGPDDDASEQVSETIPRVKTKASRDGKVKVLRETKRKPSREPKAGPSKVGRRRSQDAMVEATESVFAKAE